jgi:hypothetical protein
MPRRPRNKSDTEPAAELAVEPGYERIPRDAAGNPVFLILPDNERKRYDRDMESCEAGWRATGDPWAFAEALTLTRIYRQVPPPWLDEAGWLLACKRRTKSYAKRALEASIRYHRYLVVGDLRYRLGLSRGKACEEATRLLAGTTAAAEPDMMEAAYKAVRADIKAGRRGLYFAPKRQHRDRPSGQPSPGVGRKPQTIP